jgi:hypothetical protein
VEIAGLVLPTMATRARVSSSSAASIPRVHGITLVLGAKVGVGRATCGMIGSPRGWGRRSSMVRVVEHVEGRSEGFLWEISSTSPTSPALGGGGVQRFQRPGALVGVCAWQRIVLGQTATTWSVWRQLKQRPTKSTGTGQRRGGRAGRVL